MRATLSKSTEFPTEENKEQYSELQYKASYGLLRKAKQNLTSGTYPFSPNIISGKVIVKSLRTSPVRMSSYETRFLVLKTWQNPKNMHTMGLVECSYSHMGSGL